MGIQQGIMNVIQHNRIALNKIKTKIYEKRTDLSTEYTHEEFDNFAYPIFYFET
jgi:hypothetical protein